MSDGIRRRDFLKVIGASGAGAGILGCSTENVERLIPYVVPPEEITPGVATWYTSVCGECSAGCGIWVRTREGRAVKIEGNPAHPVAEGGLCSRGHASLQGLYDPDRFKGPMLRDGDTFRQITWEDAEAALTERLQSAGSDVLLIHGRVGPALRDAMDGFVTGIGGRRVEYQGLSEAPLREATRIALGHDVVPHFDFESARFIVSFGADFLDTWLSPAGHHRGFSRMSGVDEHGSKGEFVFVGPRLSLTGLNADEWVPIAPGSEGLLALAMANVISAGRSGGPYTDLLAAYDPQAVAGDTGVSAETIQDLAERFMEQGPSLAVGPGVAGQHRNATASNLAVMVLNAVAGNIGRTVHVQGGGLAAPSAPYSDLAAEIEAMWSGSVGVAMIHGTNPAFTLPSAAGFPNAFGAVDFKVSFAMAMDETAALADLILPDAHFLEAWGDSNPRPGVFAVQQPVMQPVPHFDSKQTGDVLLSVGRQMGSTSAAASFQDHVKARWAAVHEASGSADTFDDFWRSALKSGVVEVPTTASADAAVLRNPDAALTFDLPAFDGDGEFALVVYPSPRFGDGEHANRPWLLELPDPVSKITWHSWLEMHPKSAADHGLRKGDIVTVSSPHGSLEVPIWTYPGVREDTVAIAMGGGHSNYGRFATDNGVNPMVLLPAEVEQPSGALIHLATRVSVTPTGERRRLATIEGSSDQHDRPIAPAVALAALGEDHSAEESEGGHGQLMELQEGGGFIPVPTEGRPQDFPLAGQDYGGYAGDHPRWAMAIDLDKCTGCSACVVACQSENNVPWVGEQQVMMGRDMGWIRIERYYEHVEAEQTSHLDVRFLPMLCQHCNNAPCEPVCPVFATYHTPEGINAQVYNRCVGTRYCANNCPYKVRVFNWYRYTDDIPEPMNWQFNPDVTVRDNGVMEKCSFCVQRIRESQNRASLEGREVHDGEVIPACQQSCPAEAIVFGNIKDESSRVARMSEDERTYRVLDELINTQPAVSYLKKVTFHEVADGGH